ncbi:MAG TPA: hypothetical protein VMZ29_04720 [Candidatus Bathyarchaeia archaeon]|nr:hypothetical protein [Candidatus Bathyarchaeia archaeon]
MKLKRYLFGVLFILATLTSTFNNGRSSLVTNTITNFYYSDDIAPGETFVWDVAKFERDDNDNWTVKTDITFEEGDQFKIEVLIDPDLISITNYTELFTTTEPWAKYYKNDLLLGSDASLLNLIPIKFYSSGYDYVGGDWTYLLPTTFLVDASNVSALQYLYDINQPNEFDGQYQLYDLTITNDLLTLLYEYHYDGPMFMWEDICHADKIYEASYNLQTGLLDKLNIYYKFKSGSFLRFYYLVLLNENSTQKVGINWLSYMIPFLVFGLAIIYKRRKL